MSKNFSFINDEMTRDIIIKTYQAVSNTNNWENLKNYEVNPNNGFMFSNEQFLYDISIESDQLGAGHSGASFAYCMRNMHYIAKYGFENYVAKFK